MKLQRIDYDGGHLWGDILQIPNDEELHYCGKCNDIHSHK